MQSSPRSADLQPAAAVPVLVIGEALVDEFPTATGPDIRPGGSPANVAVGLARLGHPAALLTALGDDRNGETVRAFLRAAGVRVHAESARLGATSRAVVSTSPSGDASYAFEVEWRAPDRLAEPVPGVVHAGSIAIALEPGASAVLGLLDALPETTRVTLDPNIRQAFLPDAHEAATRIAEFSARADVVKLSDEDAAYCYPGMGPDEVLDTLLGFGPSIAAITLGAKGSVVATRTDRMRLEPIRVQVADTVGAGDSWMSAFVSYLARADEFKPGADTLRAAAEYAASAAAITVSRRGAEPPTAAELQGAEVSGSAATPR